MLFASKENGQSLVDYALILILVVIVIFGLLYFLGPTIQNIFDNINK